MTTQSTFEEALAVAVHADICDGSQNHHHGDCAGKAAALAAHPALAPIVAVVEAALTCVDADRAFEARRNLGDAQAASQTLTKLGDAVDALRAERTREVGS